MRASRVDRCILSDETDASRCLQLRRAGLADQLGRVNIGVTGPINACRGVEKSEATCIEWQTPGQ
jgi:hypothetical protein